MNHNVSASRDPPTAGLRRGSLTVGLACGALISVETGQRRVHALSVELLGVEFATNPFQPLFVLWVVRVIQDLEELSIAPDATDVLGRTGSPAFEADRVCHTGLRLQQLLDDEVVLPSVAKVIFIQQ